MHIPDQEQDDIDRLFAQLPMVEPPANLANRVLMAIPDTQAAAMPAKQINIKHQHWYSHWWVAAIAATVFFAMSMQLGTVLDSNGAFSLLGEAFNNTDTSGDYYSALLATVPWIELLFTIAAFTVFFVLTSQVMGDSKPRRSSLA